MLDRTTTHWTRWTLSTAVMMFALAGGYSCSTRPPRASPNPPDSKRVTAPPRVSPRSVFPRFRSTGKLEAFVAALTAKAKAGTHFRFGEVLRRHLPGFDRGIAGVRLPAGPIHIKVLPIRSGPLLLAALVQLRGKDFTECDEPNGAHLWHVVRTAEGRERFAVLKVTTHAFVRSKRRVLFPGGLPVFHLQSSGLAPKNCSSPFGLPQEKTTLEVYAADPRGAFSQRRRTVLAHQKTQDGRTTIQSGSLKWLAGKEPGTHYLAEVRNSRTTQVETGDPDDPSKALWCRRTIRVAQLTTASGKWIELTGKQLQARRAAEPVLASLPRPLRGMTSWTTRLKTGGRAARARSMIVQREGDRCD